MNGWINILTDLRAAIATKAAPYRGAVDTLLVLVCHRINRIQGTLQRLIAHWRAGTLPKPSPSRAGRQRTHTPKCSYPTTKAWLVVRVGYTAGGYASQLNHFIAENPDFAQFLREVPQAGRILRPLCHMLGIDPPAAIRREPPPRKPRAPRPPRPKLVPFRTPIPERLGLSRRVRFYGA